jgi:hypothetical protein
MSIMMTGLIPGNPFLLQSSYATEGRKPFPNLAVNSSNE